MTAIEVKHISKTFGDTIALNDISFEINDGEIFGFLGPSGSGKTTLIKIITNQLVADKGATKMLGKDSKRLLPTDFEQMGIVSDESGYFEKMTLEVNLKAYAKIYGVSSQRLNDILTLVGLKQDKKKLAEKLSTGMRQRMLLARALINSPKILFLDEPTSGLDPMTSQKIHQLLLELKQKGTTIFLTTHDMNEATLLCDNLALLNKGKLVEQGRPREIIQKYNTDKALEVTYEDFTTEKLAFSELHQVDTEKAIKIHSCEPTLEDIFIKVTGENLND